MKRGSIVWLFAGVLCLAGCSAVNKDGADSPATPSSVTPAPQQAAARPGSKTIDFNEIYTLEVPEKTQSSDNNGDLQINGPEGGSAGACYLTVALSNLSRDVSHESLKSGTDAILNLMESGATASPPVRVTIDGKPFDKVTVVGQAKSNGVALPCTGCVLFAVDPIQGVDGLGDKEHVVMTWMDETKNQSWYETIAMSLHRK